MHFEILMMTSRVVYLFLNRKLDSNFLMYRIIAERIVNYIFNKCTSPHQLPYFVKADN